MKTRFALLALALLSTAPVAMSGYHADDATPNDPTPDADGVDESVAVGWSATTVIIVIVVAIVVVALIAGLTRRHRV